MNITTLINDISKAKFFININTKKDFLREIKTIMQKNHGGNLYVINYIYIGFLYSSLIDQKFLGALKSSNFVYLDGFLIGIILRYFYKLKKERFSTQDFIQFLFFYCQKNNKKVFLFGSSPDGVNMAVSNIRKLFPKIKIEGTHGYHRNSAEPINIINSSGAELLILGLGLGNQEIWIEKNKHLLKDIKASISVGNYIDILGEKKKLPPEILNKLNLRWLYRIGKEPKRLLMRYIISFLILVLIISTMMTKNIKDRIFSM